MSKELHRAIRIGNIISGYKIVALSRDSAMGKAVSKMTPVPYVVWNLDYDKCGVWGGRYREEHKVACNEFALCVRLEST
ncbi:MAG: hypothetical protein FWE74_07585 [Oscillospiraceae bacterium]|nr:hypothetical protein [Oscillospiraceae bacterium]